jgi:hypothetical protein
MNLEEARGIAAQCWCDEVNASKEMDVELAESVAMRILAAYETGVRATKPVGGAP